MEFGFDVVINCLRENKKKGRFLINSNSNLSSIWQTN